MTRPDDDDGAAAPSGVVRVRAPAAATWPAVALAVAAGLALWAAHPPVGAWWTVLLVVGLWAAAVDLARDASTPVVAAVGAVTGLVAFLPMLSWLVLPAGFVGWLLLSLIQAAWTALGAVVLRPWIRTAAAPVVAAVVWTALEVARARVPLSGFGWGDLASAHTDASWMLTTARLLGADGLTLLTALLGALGFDVVRRLATTRAPEQPSRRSGGPPSPGAARAVHVVDAARPSTLALVGVGALGLLLTVEPPPVVGTIEVLAVQGNDGTSSGSARDVDRAIATALADATTAAVAAQGLPDLVVWPENGLDRDPFASGDLTDVLRAAAAGLDGRLVVGTNLDGDVEGTWTNSALVIGADGTPLDRVDKQVPVPFGEYVPLRGLLGDLPPLRQIPRDAVPGDGPSTLDVAGTRIGVLICFETMFPRIAAGAVQDGAALLVASTNDASFGRTAAPAQHLAQSRLRAVETGRAVVHAALSGRSALVLPDGTVEGTGPLFEVAALRYEAPLVEGTTPALVVAPVLRVVVLALAAGAAVGGVVLRRRGGA